MISQEKFDQIEMDYDCGYWFECCERCCPCAITTENKGLTQKIWDGMKEEQKQLRETYNPNEFDFLEDDLEDEEDVGCNEDCKNCDECPGSMRMNE